MRANSGEKIMESQQVTLVKQSFEKVRPIADTAAALFYQRLFEIAPQVKPLFKGDMETQGRVLMSTLGMVVAGLDKPETTVPAQQLAVRHVDYGVASEHYTPVGEALLWTLEQGLGADFTPEVKDAWVAAYDLLASVMKQAAYAKALPAD
jgi:nitric oxide dioxygenase